MGRAALTILVLWTVAGFLARSAASQLLNVFGVTPDLLTLVVVYWALAGGPLAGVLAGFVLGLAADAEVGRYLGLSAGVLAAVGYGIGSVSSSLHRERPLAQFVVLLLATVLALSVRTLFAVGGHLPAWLEVLPLHVALRSLYTAILGPALYFVVSLFGVGDFLAHGTAPAKPGS